MDIQHTAVRITDLEATKSFYEDGLELEYSHDFHTDGGVHTTTSPRTTSKRRFSSSTTPAATSR